MYITFTLLNDDGSQENTRRLSQWHIKQGQVMGVAGPGEGIFYHWHCLELPAHGDNKKQIDFQLGLLLFLNSQQQCTPLLPVPIVGPPPCTSRVHG